MAEAKKYTGNKTEISGMECPDCNNETVVRDYQRSILICESCGRIVKEGIKDRGPEWRAFNQEQREERSRSGPPYAEGIHDRGLSTQIDRGNKDTSTLTT